MKGWLAEPQLGLGVRVMPLIFLPDTSVFHSVVTPVANSPLNVLLCAAWEGRARSGSRAAGEQCVGMHES